MSVVLIRRGSRGPTQLAGFMKVLGGQGVRGAMSKQASVTADAAAAESGPAGLFQSRYRSILPWLLVSFSSCHPWLNFHISFTITLFYLHY